MESEEVLFSFFRSSFFVPPLLSLSLRPSIHALSR